MKATKWCTVLVLVVGLSLGFAFGVGAQPRAGGTLIMGLGEEPDTLDPDETNRFHSLVVLNYVVEPLFALNKDYEAVPLLINGFEWSEDKLTMTVHLKEGITFHNGEEMTSEDVRASYERYFRLSPLANYLPPKYGGIVKIETPDDYTVIFHF
ncbi:MAG: ABC transporter substrate-binding protein, partial [candidate division WOR-3 bacterium]|nr:ABC transporter substrate-binding protein [candidate division WOR-3 bacterium]